MTSGHDEVVRAAYQRGYDYAADDVWRRTASAEEREAWTRGFVQALADLWPADPEEGDDDGDAAGGG